MKHTLIDFIAGQIANAESPQAAKLAVAMRECISEYRENGGENEDAFSVDAQYEDGEFSVQCAFHEDDNMTIMYHEATDSETVASLFSLQNDPELCRLAGLMLSEGWVKGYKG